MLSLRLRPWVLTAGFGVLFAVMANLAWLTAIGTTGPWYGSTVSLETYGLSLGIATLLAAVLTLSASNRAGAMDARLRRLDRGISLLKAAPAAAHETRRAGPSEDDLDLGLDLDDELGGMVESGRSAVVGVEKEGHDALIEISAIRNVPASGRRTEVLRELVRERIALREARASIWRTVAGPVSLSTLFVAVAGVMIPGAEGFAATHYQLNTALVLFLSYGLAPLVAWAVISLGSLAAASHRSVA